MNVWTSTGKRSTLVLPHESVWDKIFNFNHPVVDSVVDSAHSDGTISDAWEKLCRSLEQKTDHSVTLHFDAEEIVLANAVSPKIRKCIRSLHTRKFGDGFWFYTENMLMMRFTVEFEGFVHECLYYVDISTLGQNIYLTGIVPFNASWSRPISQLTDKPHCGHCFKPGREVVLKKCRVCQGVVYCSKACQVKHWVLGHSKTCAKY